MKASKDGESASSGPVPTSEDDDLDRDDDHDDGVRYDEEVETWEAISAQHNEEAKDDREQEPQKKSSSMKKKKSPTIPSQQREGRRDSPSPADDAASRGGGLVQWLRLWFHAMSRRGEEEDHDHDQDDNSDGSSHPPRRSTSLVQRCLDDLKARASEGLDDRTVKSLATSFAVTAMLLVLDHQRRKRRATLMRRQAIQSSSSSDSFLSAVEAPLSLLYRSTNAGQVHTALLGAGGGGHGDTGSSNVVYYRLKADGSASSSSKKATWRKSILPASVAKEFIHSLSMHCDNVSAIPEAAASALSTRSSLAWAPILTTAIPFAYLFFLYKIVREGLLSSLGGSGDEKSKRDAEALKMMTPQTTRITFQDVAGMPQQVVTDLREVVAYLSDPHRYAAVGARPPRAVLLHGPPGSGKTLLAQAVAGEANVPFFACSASEFVEVYVGRGASRVRALFAQARKAAVHQRRQLRQQRHPSSDAPATPQQYLQSILQSVLPWLAPSQWSSPDSPSVPSAPRRDVSTCQVDRPAASILFIDELDALGKSRMSSGSNDEREQTLNQLLTELDGFGSREREFREEAGDGGGREDDDDDEAGRVIVIAATNRVDVLDPAILRRFERQIHVGYPATPKDRKDVLLVHARRVRCGADVDWDRIASDARTLGCSGADLANLVNEAALLAVREGSPVIEQDQLDHAARRIQSMKWREDHPGELLLGLRSAGIR